MNEFSISCVTCSTDETVLFSEKSDTNGLIYYGNCSSSLCVDLHHYVCKPCHEYTKKNTRKGGGRIISQYNTLKSLKQHVKNSKVHAIALSEFNPPNENFNFECNDNQINELPTSIDNVFTNDDNNANRTLDLELDSMNDTQRMNTYSSKPLGFDSKSKAINYYEYEKKILGMGQNI
jgi:hypothetical protein